jgi:modulator of FtsH protease HflK
MSSRQRAVVGGQQRVGRYLGLALILGLAVYLLTGVTQVRPGERAVVRRLGRVVDKPGPGLRVGLPWGFERVDRVAVDQVRRVRIGFRLEAEEGEEEETPAGQLLTGDQDLVNVQVLVDYTIADDQVEDFLAHADRADGMIARAAEAVLAGWIAARHVDDVLARGKIDLPRALVEGTQALVTPYQLGVVLRDASVVHLLPPDEVRPAFDEVSRAQTSMRTRENEARREAARRRREAETESARISKLTGAYVQEQLVSARAEAASFEKRLDQYQRLRRENPSFLAGIWWDSMGRLLGRLQEDGRLDLLDNRLGSEGLDITVAPPLPRKK